MADCKILAWSCNILRLRIRLPSILLRREDVGHIIGHCVCSEVVEVAVNTCSNAHPKTRHLQCKCMRVQQRRWSILTSYIALPCDMWECPFNNSELGGTR